MSLSGACFLRRCQCLGVDSFGMAVFHVLFVSCANCRSVISLARNGVSAKCCVLI